MTCIVGVTDGEKTWIGCDSAVSNFLQVSSIPGGKVFRRGPLLIGFAGAPRLMYALKYALKTPRALPDNFDGVGEYMAVDFPRAVKKAFKKCDIPKLDDDEDECSGGRRRRGRRQRGRSVGAGDMIGSPVASDFSLLPPDGGVFAGKKKRRVSATYYNMGLLVAAHGCLYRVFGDLTAIPAEPVAVMGSGSLAADGALDALVSESSDPEELVFLALETASRRTPFVRPPYMALNTVNSEKVVVSDWLRPTTGRLLEPSDETAESDSTETTD